MIISRESIWTDDPSELKNHISEKTCLVSIMFGNNEVGTIQPISEITKICNETNILFHTDAVQAVGKIPIDVKELGIDLLSISSHKLYGPKGIGALFIKNGLDINPVILGGGKKMDYALELKMLQILLDLEKHVKSQKTI